ncbi:MAG: GGDEF domain-containing protein [Campylobacterota bacterium]|nr:GGDEF domain-containing protein [Campylobacterota bacterium]
MIESVRRYLEEVKISYKEFDRLINFYEFIDTVKHKQYFEDVCTVIAKWFEDSFKTDAMKITTYDIEQSVEKVVYESSNTFDEHSEPFVLSFDFSKSYQLNGRIFFKFNNAEYKEKVDNDKLYLDFIFYELRSILINHFAIKKLQDSSFMDDTLHLPNRKFLIAHLNNLTPIVLKENIELAVLKIEVDRFKAVVDEFNYDIGVQVLKKLTEILKSNISDTDLVTKFDHNSFLICMQDVKDDSEISSLAQKCIDDFAKQEVIVDDSTKQTLKKTICVGISIYPKDGETLDELFKNTDIALDEAKNLGRSSYEFYKNEQNSAIDFF